MAETGTEQPQSDTPVAAPVLTPSVAPLSRDLRVPKLTSRKSGGLVVWVVDRHALAKATAAEATAAEATATDPNPASPISPPARHRNDGSESPESPKTPSYKPPMPSRIDDSKATKVEHSEASKSVQQVAEAQTAQDENNQSGDEAGEDSDSETCASETATEGPSPCSEGHSSDSQEYQHHSYGIPVWPVYFPVAGYPKWWDVPEFAAQHLDACYQNALNRAERREAPTDETCCVGCCCSRCIGLPAAYQKCEKNMGNQKLPKEKELPEASETLKGKDCDSVSVKSLETATSTSISENSSDSDMDVEQILKQLPPRRVLQWLTPDRRLQQHLRHRDRPRDHCTVVCSNLDPEATATDLQQAFEHRFLSIPDFVDGYWKKGKGS